MALGSRVLRGAAVAWLLGTVLCSGFAGAQVLTSGELLISGARLRVSPAFQEIDPGRATLVFTDLGGLGAGQLPPGLRVEAELGGPGLVDALHLTTVPGEPFHIPGLNREGTYLLSGIRLTRDGTILQAAEPSEVEIYVHRLVIASVTSRPLTPEEMEAYGIVISEDSYTAWHYTVGFQVEGEAVEIPFDVLSGPDGFTPLAAPNPYYLPIPHVSGPMPTISWRPIQGVSDGIGIDLARPPEGVTGGPMIPGFLIFPTDIAFLNQFFAVIMVVQNGALADSGIELRDLSAVLELHDAGVRQAETEPPTIPGQPVPVMDPGPDGEIGTADDLTIIIAGASGESTWLVEGLEEGQHMVTAHLTGELHGLASGEVEPIAGDIPGVVLVRDPRFSMTFFHPWTVRAGEPYDFSVVVANTSTQPVYDLSLNLPPGALTGALLIGPEEQDPIDELLPGGSAMVSWQLEATTTGMVVATAFNTSEAMSASFRFEVGVGELGIPLSPSSLALPRVVEHFDEEVGLVPTSLELLGLAYSLATAPNGVEVDLPPMGESTVKARGSELALCARRLEHGESLPRAVMNLGLRWLGHDRWDTAWDVLRRASYRGLELEAYSAKALEDHIDSEGAVAAFADLEELAISGRTTLLVYAEGAGYDGTARLKLVGGGSGTAAVGQLQDEGLVERYLPGAAMLEVVADSGGWSGEVGVVAIPIDEDGAWLEPTYQVQLLGSSPGAVDLEAVLVMPDGSTRRVAPDTSVGTAAGSFAFFDLDAVVVETTLYADSDGDGIADRFETLSVDPADAPEPRVLAARFSGQLNWTASARYDDLIVMLSQPMDVDALPAIDVDDWVISSHLELTADNGDVVVSDLARHGELMVEQSDPAIFVLSTDRPLNPHATMTLSTGVDAIPMLGGRSLDLVGQTIEVGDGLATGAVRGVVIGADGQVVPGARVQLFEHAIVPTGSYSSHWLPCSSDSTVADENGAFLLDAVRYRAGQVDGRYAAFVLLAVDPVTGHEARLSASLAGDATVRDLTVFMVGRGDVVGTLSRLDGAPLSDEAAVYGRSVSNPEEYSISEVDGLGNYRLTDLPVGGIQVLAVDGLDYAFGTAMVPGPGQEGHLDLEISVVTEALAQVQGTVTDGDNAMPLEGVQVYLLPQSAQSATHMKATGADGAFTMADVPPGISTFKVWDPVRATWLGAITVELIGDSLNTVAIVTSPASTASIRGTVYSLEGGSRTPVPGAYVIATSRGKWVITDAAGAYLIEELILGEVHLDAMNPTTGQQTARFVDLIAEGQELVVDLDLPPSTASGGINVTVVDHGGVAMSNVPVAVERFYSELVSTTDGDGSAFIAGVGTGTHRVIARLGGRLGTTTTTVVFDGHVAEAVIELGDVIQVHVQIVAELTGGEITPVMASVGYRRPGINMEGYLVALPEEGEYPCEQDENMICHISGVPEGVGGLQVVARNDLLGEASLNLELTPEDHGRTFTLNFSAPGMLSGRVLTRDGDDLVPVANARVQLHATQPGSTIPQPQSTMHTNGYGEFRFDLVPSGLFAIRVYSDEVQGVAWVNGVIQAGQIIDDLDLEVVGPGSLQGSVAVCEGEGTGQNVHLRALPSGLPLPFFSDFEVPELREKTLTLGLDAGVAAEFLFTGLAHGQWNLRAVSTLHAAAFETAHLEEPGVTVALTEPMCLQPTGSVSGQVIYPESGAGAPSVQVQVFRIGDSGPELVSSQTTDEAGFYSFADLPVKASYQVRAHDAASNRGGTGEWQWLCPPDHPGHGDTCHQHDVSNILLAGLATIQGRVLDQDGAGIVNAYLRLRTSVVVNANGQVVEADRELIAFSGGDGGYSFAGIPAGDAEIAAFAPASPLKVELVRAVDPVDEPLIDLDLVMPATAELTVRVLDPAGVPLDGEQAAVAFEQSAPLFFGEPTGGGYSVEHLDPGEAVTFAGVVPGAYKAAACVGDCGLFTVDDLLGQSFAEALGASLNGLMTDPVADQQADVLLVGRAGARVLVNQAGVPVEGCEVRLDGRGHYGSVQLVTQTGSDGRTSEIPNLGVGEYSVAAVLTDGSGDTLRGAGSFAVVQADHGSVLDVAVELEAAGAASGVLLNQDLSPAEGGLVTMRSSDGRLFQAFAAVDGAFLFAALPSGGGYALEAYSAVGGGRFSEQDLVVGDDELLLGEIVLDDSNPAVAETVPANGAQAVIETTTVVVDFSELMRHETLTSQRLRLREHGSGALVSCSLSVEDVAGAEGSFTRVTLYPAALDSKTLYVIDVLRGVQDLAGRTLTVDNHFTFTTRDSEPPLALTALPENDEIGITPVGPDVEPVITFNEPVDAATVTDTTVRLLDDMGEPVGVLLEVQREGFDVRLSPGSGLELDRFYTLWVQGVGDASGNVQTEPWQSTFRVRDDEAPVAALLLPINAFDQDGVWRLVEGSSVTLQASVASNDAVAEVIFSVDGTQLPPAGYNAGCNCYSIGIGAPTGVDQLNLAVQAWDVSGNPSNVDSRVLEVVEDNPPSGTMTLNPTPGILPNHELLISVAAEDDYGLKAAYLTLSGAVETQETLWLAGTSSSGQSSFRVPVDAAAGEQIVVSCEVEDQLNQRTPLPPQAVTVLADITAPSALVQSPASGESFVELGPVPFSFDLADDVVVESAALELGGEAVTLTVSNVQLPGGAWTATAAGSAFAPEVQVPESVAWSLTLADAAGNATTIGDEITVQPVSNPDAPVVSFLCPTDGDHCVAELAQSVHFNISDEDSIASYTFTANGEATTVTGPFSPPLQQSFTWTPPADASAGDSFELRVSATDAAGNVGAAVIQLWVPTGLLLTGDHELSPSLVGGQDLVIAGGTFTATTELAPASLLVLPETTLTVLDGTHSLQLAVAGAVAVECGAAIDLVGRGYPAGQTYPGEVRAGNYGGGSHMGHGGIYRDAGTTYGSVIRPLEPGGGGRVTYAGDYGYPGGGVLRLDVAGDLRMDGIVTADGATDVASSYPSGAGGSVWITVAGELNGTGSILARGGHNTSSPRTGGGGAISLSYGAAAGAVLNQIQASGGAGLEGLEGGAGTVHLLDGLSSTFGDLVVDNMGINGEATELPSLGGGEALTGTAAALLETDRASIQPFYVGHWVELVDVDTGQVKGPWQIVEIDGGTLTLNIEGHPEGAKSGDAWQGVYRFDSILVRGGAVLVSDDPIRSSEAVIGDGQSVTTLLTPLDVTGAVRLQGGVAARSIAADQLVVAAGARLSHPPIITPDSPEHLDLRVRGQMLVEPGAEIDLSGLGYLAGQTYPGELRAGNYGGGSHMAHGGIYQDGGTTYGSVTRPMEAGGGGRETYAADYGYPGGGVLRLEVNGGLVIDGIVTADGATDDTESYPRGAGGSVWITVDGELSGTGSIFARGAPNSAARGTGGGGAISLSYGSATGGVLANLGASGGAGVEDWQGGAGTVYLFDALSSTFGDLRVDNNGINGEATELPGLGGGTAMAGSAGDVLVTDRTEIQPYFVGHWIEVVDADTGEVKGPWSARAIAGGTLTLDIDGHPDGVEPGDAWRGLYRFDQLTVAGNAHLVFGDLHEISGAITVEPGSSVIFANSAAPQVGPMSLTAASSLFWISAPPSTFSDDDGIGSVVLRNLSSGVSWTPTLGDGGFAALPITGESGDAIQVEVSDAHPSPLTTIITVGTLPANAGAPLVLDGLVTINGGGGGVYTVAAPDTTVTDPEQPVTVVISNTTTQQSFSAAASGAGAFSIVVQGSSGDSLELTAEDGHPEPLSTTVSLGQLGGGSEPQLSFSIASVFVDEWLDELRLTVVLDSEPQVPVTVDWYTAEGSATGDSDFWMAGSSLDFEVGETSQDLVVALMDDDQVEGDESFTVTLESPVGATLGAVSSAIVTLVDNDGVAPRDLVYSVRPGGGDLLGGMINFDLVDGEVVFATDLPAGPDAGDLIDTGETTLLIRRCEDARRCAVTDSIGGEVADMTGATAVQISPAFTSLAAALSGLAGDFARFIDDDPYADLVFKNATIGIACYGGIADSQAVHVNRWIAADGTALRIYSAAGADHLSSGHRHQGRWTDTAYRLEVNGSTCIRITQSTVLVDGLQLACSASTAQEVMGFEIDTFSDVLIDHSLIRLDTLAAAAQRTGIWVGSADLSLRNSVLWDLGDGTPSGHSGINLSADAALRAFNNTIVGGDYGIRNDDGAFALVSNNLVTGATTACFSGGFDFDSRHNLASDDTAPEPPPVASGPLTVANPAAGTTADFHLRCGVLEQALTISHDFAAEPVENAFDGDPETSVTAVGSAEASIRLIFDQARTLTGTAVSLSECDQYDWRLEVADNETDMDAGSGSYREPIPWTGISHNHRIWAQQSFASPETATVVQLSLRELCGGEVVLHEWNLQGHNPACSNAIDLAGDPTADFSDDVDSRMRIGSWDIGADQSRFGEAQVGFAFTPETWWESESEALFQVLLSEPATRPVSVSFRTVDGTAMAGMDYLGTAGQLVFTTGQASKIIAVPLLDDGTGDPGESFSVQLFDAHGARLEAADSVRTVVLQEGPAPLRVAFDQATVHAAESDGYAVLDLVLTSPAPYDLVGYWATVDGTAHIGADYDEAQIETEIFTGNTSASFAITVNDDGVDEGDESFLVRLHEVYDIEAGVPAVAVVQIDGEGGGGGGEYSVSPENFTLDTSGCVPVLHGDPYSVMGPEPIRVEVHVQDASGGSWWSESIQVVQEQTYQFALGYLGGSSTITVFAGAPAAEPAAATQIAVGVWYPPDVSAAALGTVVEGSTLTVTVPAAAITDRVTDLRLTLENQTTAISEQVVDPCVLGADSSAQLAVVSGDAVVLEACNGHPEYELCASTAILWE